MPSQAQTRPAFFATTAESARIRDSMRAAPSVLALPLTLLTGKPYSGQPAPPMTPATHVVGAAASTASGLILSWLAFTAGGAWDLLLPFTCAATLHGVRNARMMIYHQSAHRNLWGRPKLDRVLGRVIAGLLLVQDFQKYSQEHVADHHAVHHMTVRDPTVQAFLIGLGLAPGMSRAQMWRRVVCRLVSPVYHANFLLGRIQSYFRPAHWTTRLMTIACYAAAAALVTWAQVWPFVLIAWVLPMTIPYQVSNTLRLCVKHTFPEPGHCERRGREHFGRLTNAIFLGESAPGADGTRLQRTLAWLRWWMRMLTVHLPARYLVLTGDTVVHDHHHRFPMSRRWANYIFDRQADVNAGHPGWPEHREVWGFVPAVNVVFDSLSQASPEEYNLEQLGRVSRRDLFSAFDD
jgi:fatty acid desaturase